MIPAELFDAHIILAEVSFDYVDADGAIVCTQMQPAVKGDGQSGLWNKRLLTQE